MEKTVTNLSLTLAEVLNDTISALDGIQISLNSLVQILMDNNLPLDFLWPIMAASVPLLILALLVSMIGHSRTVCTSP